MDDRSTETSWTSWSLLKATFALGIVVIAAVTILNILGG